MKQEDYVTEDVARTLKEKGYKEKCRGYYYGGMFSISCFGNEYNNQNVDYIIDAPSLAQAAKWLREKHNISVEPKNMGFLDAWECFIMDMSEGRMKQCGEYISTYEQALNEGIKEALKMI